MNKYDIVNEIAQRIECLEVQENFNNHTGTSQVENKNEYAKLKYAQYATLVSLYEDITNSTWITNPKHNIVRLH